MPRCPLCGTAHIVVTVRPRRRGHCVRCDLQWGLDAPASRQVPEGSPGTRQEVACSA